MTLKTIAFAEHGLDVVRVSGVIPEGIADLSDRGVNAVVRVEIEVLPPEPLNNFLASDQPSPLPHQQDEQIHRDTFHAHRSSGTSEFVPVCIQDKRSEL